MSTNHSLACVIVDDNEINRLTLERSAERHDQLVLAASFPNAVEALALRLLACHSAQPQ